MGQTANEILNLNRQQMYSGLDNRGEPIRPKYSEDPYFKSKEAALRYAQWKKQITPHPQRDIDTPNLFITGRYHMSLELSVNEERYTIQGTDVDAAKIEKKFKTAMGLNDESKSIYRRDTMHPLLVKRIKLITETG